VSNILQDDATRQEFGPVVYVPYRQRASGSMWVMARTRIAPNNLITPFRSEFLAMDPDLDIYGPMSMADRLEGFLDSRFYGGLFLIFAALALLLASIGLYAVIAHSVSQRTQEIGIRLAIGAAAQDILKLVLVQGMVPLAAGLGLGLAGSVILNRLLKSMLVNVSAADPITLFISSLVLIAAALLGCWIPARRAMLVEPLVALRYE
jgi:putative ABC transport system permease protein